MAQLIWTEPALDDLDDLAGYIAMDNPMAAGRLVQKVIENVGRLERFPHSRRKPHDLPGTPYREIVVSPCRIFYRFDGQTVFIVHAMREEQQIDRFLLDERENRRHEAKNTNKHGHSRPSPNPCGTVMNPK